MVLLVCSSRINDPWSNFNLEQKAQIVVDWFATGERTQKWEYRWPYIRDYVRKDIP